MKPERWHEVDEILQSVLERDPAERGAYLDEVCAGDEQLRNAVLTVMASNRKDGTFVASPGSSSKRRRSCGWWKTKAGRFYWALPDQKADRPWWNGRDISRRAHNPEPGVAADATGYRGFYYHFLDMKTGKRVWNCELSTIDTTFLLAGALTAALYLNHDSEAENEIRSLADACCVSPPST